MTIPARTTIAQWLTLIEEVPAHEHLAATTHEMDALWPSRSGAAVSISEVAYAGFTILGHLVVEIPDWPDWMP